MRFKQSPVRLHPGEDRGVSLVIDPAQVPPGTPVIVAADAGLRLRFWGDALVPEPNRSGWSRMTGTLRARVSVEPGARLTVIAEAAGHCAELEVLMVRHRASGWVSEIARKDEDALIEAHFDPESGIVTVYEGGSECKALERAARRAGLKPSRVREYLPYRMLEVEVAANAVYQWAAEQIVARRLAGELRNDPVEYAHALRHEAQALRQRAHEKLMRAFLDPEVFAGGVRVIDDEPVSRGGGRPIRAAADRRRAPGASRRRSRRGARPAGGVSPCHSLPIHESRDANSRAGWRRDGPPRYATGFPRRRR
jgi:hypothetical protein